MGDSTTLGNCFWFDSSGSAIIPKGSAEITTIRQLVGQCAQRIPMKKERNVYQLDAWVDGDAAAGFGR